MVKNILIGVFVWIIIVAGIFVGCTVSPKFRDAYTGFSNQYEAKIHNWIKDHTGLNIPYTQYDNAGKIVVIK